MSLSHRRRKKSTSVARGAFAGGQVLVGVAQVASQNQKLRVVVHDVIKRGGGVVRQPQVPHDCYSSWVRLRAWQWERREVPHGAENVCIRITALVIVQCIRKQTCAPSHIPFTQLASPSNTCLGSSDLEKSQAETMSASGD